MKECVICGVQNADLHHIIFRSQASYMSNIKVNFIYLCPKHHRGNLSPHMKRQIDLKHKKMLQDKLQEVFKGKEYYKATDIKERLETTQSEIKKLTKTLKVYKEGYKADEIIKHCLGDKFY